MILLCRLLLLSNLLLTNQIWQHGGAVISGIRRQKILTSILLADLLALLMQAATGQTPTWPAAERGQSPPKSRDPQSDSREELNPAHNSASIVEPSDETRALGDTLVKVS